VKKYGREEDATHDNIINRMRFACWINKATGTHVEYLIPTAFSTATMVNNLLPSNYGTKLCMHFTCPVHAIFPFHFILVDNRRRVRKYTAHYTIFSSLVLLPVSEIHTSHSNHVSTKQPAYTIGNRNKQLLKQCTKYWYEQTGLS